MFEPSAPPSHRGVFHHGFQGQTVRHGTSDATHGEMVVEVEQAPFIVDDGIGPSPPRVPGKTW